MHVATVPPDRDAEPVRSFGTFAGACIAWRIGWNAAAPIRLR
jgi:hypothetical protein